MLMQSKNTEIPDFYKVGQTYKMLGYKDILTLYELTDTMANFTWMNGLKYHTYHHGKRHSFMYRNIRSIG